MIRRYLFLLSVLFPLGVCAQTEKQAEIDILKSDLKQAKADTVKIRVLCELSSAYSRIDSVKTFEMANRAITLSEKIGNLKGSVNSYFTLGQVQSDYSMLSESITNLTKGANLADKLVQKDSSKTNLELWAKGHYNLGINYAYSGNYDKYLSYTNRVIPVVELTGDSIFLANIHTNLGIGYINLNQYESAYKSLQSGNKIYEALKNPEESTYNRLSLAVVLYNLDSLGRMKQILDKTRSNLEKYPNPFDSYSFYNQEGMYYEGKNDYRQAIASLDRALGFAQGDEYSLQHTATYDRYARIYESMKEYKKALAYNEKSLKGADIRNDRFDYSTIMVRIARLKAQLDRSGEAYADLVSGYTIKDSLENQQKVSQLAELELKYDTEKKEKEILALQNVNNRAALSAAQKKSQIYLLVGLVSLLGFLVLTGSIFYRNKLRSAKRKEQRQEAEVLLLRQEQENKIFSAMIEGQEQERKRLAVDLHDGLGGRLSGISLNLSKLEKDSPEAYQDLQLPKVRKDLGDSLTELRSIARDMMPETLMRFGLNIALKDYCSTMSSEETQVSLQFYGDEQGINDNQKITLYRIVQELINNAVKHAKASEILVQYMREGSNIDITVEDNGVGFIKKPSPKEDLGGMGLSNLHTRVAYLKGEINFDTQENEGTTVNINLTVNAA